MQFKYAHILEALEYESRTVLCQIKVIPRSMEYYHGQVYRHYTHRWMQAEHWANFDAGMEKIISKYSSSKTTDCNDIDEQFLLNALIMVRVRNSSLPVKSLCRSVIGSKLETNDILLSLECCIEYQQDGKWSNEEKQLNDGAKKNTIEYEPQSIGTRESYISPLKTEGGSVPYVPYTPSAKCDPLVPIEIEEPYSPKPVVDSGLNNIVHTPPLYNPARIEKSKTKTSDDLQINEETIDKEGKITASQSESKKKTDTKKTTKNKEAVHRRLNKNVSDVEKQTLCDYIDMKNIEVKDEFTPSVSMKIKVDSADKSNTRSQRNFDLLEDNENNVSDDSVLPSQRRSKRATSKPVHLTEFEINLKGVHTKRTNSKSPTTIKIPSKKHKNLFGSDNDDDMDDFVPPIPIITALAKATVSNEGSYKRKHTTKRKPENCENEKKTMTTWLGKKSSGSESTPSKPDYNTTPEGKKLKYATSSSVKKKRNQIFENSLSYGGDTISDLTSEEIEQRISKEKDQIENNYKLKKILEDWAGPSPEKVKILSLNNISTKEIINSLKDHKPMLDNIFYKSSKNTNIRSHDGIDHYLVISLIGHDKQLEMMNKLGDMYEQHHDGSSSYATLFANAMMPEWIMGIFMDRFKLTRSEAIKQVKAQEAYKLHLETKTQNSLLMS